MIDTTRPVKLLKMAVNRGNIYHPRIYNPGELPEEVLARVDILQQDEAKSPDAVLTPTINNSDVKVENSISFSVEAPSTIPKAFPTETVIVGLFYPKQILIKPRLTSFLNCRVLGLRSPLNSTKHGNNKPLPLLRI